MTGGIFGRKNDPTSVRSSTYVARTPETALKSRTNNTDISVFWGSGNQPSSQQTQQRSSGTTSYTQNSTQKGKQITNTARKYLQQGYQEYTQAEIDNMQKQGKDISHTQHTFLKPFLGLGSGEHKVTEDSSWCAAFANRVAHDNKILNQNQQFCGVQQFVDWGKKNNRYKPIATNTTRAGHLEEDRAQRASQIQSQLPNMKSGDFIIWKSPSYQVKTNQGIKTEHSSHIGVIENVDTKKGIVTVIEGNANVNVTGRSERYVVDNKAQGKNGNQEIGEFQEKNRRDGLIRKTYTITDLAKFGYSGYIDNNK